MQDDPIEVPTDKKCKWCEAPIWPLVAGLETPEDEWVTKFHVDPYGHKHQPGVEIVSRFRDTGKK